MNEGITYVGLDEHQERIHAAVLLEGIAKPVEDQWANTPEDLRRWIRRLRQRAPGEVMCCYEAGPLGFGLSRELENAGSRARGLPVGGASRIPSKCPDAELFLGPILIQ